MSILHVRVVKIHTEHSYVQHPILNFEDKEHKVFNQILKILSTLLVPYFYKNHFVIECIDGNDNIYYIGYDDNMISIGTEMSVMNDSKSFEVSYNLSTIILK